MKIRILLSFLALCISISGYAYDNGKDCSHNCFSTVINSVNATEDGCYNYSLTVSYNGDCTYALSHFTLDSSCGIITALSNSEDWKQEIGNTDPTTNLTGFKIDDIQGFGEDDQSGSFTIEFTICPEDTECAEALSSWLPVVAYKAGQCVYYETLTNPYAGGGSDDGSTDDGTNGNQTDLNGALTPLSPTCADSNDGAITLEVSGGDGPYQFLWSTGATTQNINNLAAGTYSVAITDIKGSVLNLSTTLTAPTAITVNYEITNASCGSTNDGAISITASGGTGSYTYLWSDGSTGTSISNLAPGDYGITVTDGAGCTFSQIFTVGTVNQILVDGLVTKTSCGQNDGAIDITVSGGSGTYTYLWLDGATTEDRELLAPGFYTVTVTDEGGCESTRTFSVKEDNPLSVSGTITATGCPDDSTGAITLSVTGATGNISYLWSTGATTQNLSGLSKGRYDVTVTDDANCSITKSFYVFGETLALQSTVLHPTCFGDADGSILLTSEENITVSWSNGATTTEITGLSEGVYTATVSNDAGCTSTFNYYIDAPDAITYTTTVTNSTCDPAGYSVSINITGGTSPYQVIWEDNYQGATRDGLSEGTYNFTITDSKGCQISGVVVVDSTSTNCTDTTDPTTGDDGTGDDGTGDDGTGDDGTGDDGTGDDGTGDDGTGDDGTGDDGTGDDGTGDDGTGDDGTGGDGTGDDGTGDDGAGDDGTGDDGTGDDGSGDDGSGDDGSGDDGTGDDGTNNDSDCGDPYQVEITLSETGDCITYTGKIIYTGDKTYGLSHAVISPSCGSIDGIYTEIGQFENGTDPTTGLNGLKIDEIRGFGEGNETEELDFTFELCNSECEDSETVSFIVSYKFGQCVTYDTINATLPQAKTTVSAYPNPAAETINFSVDNKSEDVNIALYNMMGILMREKTFSAGENIQLDVYDLPNDYYMYRINMGSDVHTGKILISHN